MSTPELRHQPMIVIAALTIAMNAAAAPPTTPNLGKPLTPAQTAALAGSSIYPDGRGLPPGQGSVAEGKRVYEQQCRDCHGEAGTGGSGGLLIAGESIHAADPDRGVDNYWPFATTLFDFTRRAMPLDAPGSLSDDEVYAVCAYLLNLGGIIEANAQMNAVTLPQVKMPNRDGFVWIDAKKPATSKRR